MANKNFVRKYIWSLRKSSQKVTLPQRTLGSVKEKRFTMDKEGTHL